MSYSAQFVTQWLNLGPVTLTTRPALSLRCAFGLAYC
jgi:hypothetical protein